MKNIKNNKITNFIVAFMFLLLSTSCSDWINHKINVDPDSPTDVPMSLILTPIQQSMGYNLLGNNSVRTTGIWMQQFDGTDRQSFTEARYQLTPADVENLWNSIYVEMLENDITLINKGKSETSLSPNFVGVGQVLMATTLGISTDLFGDIPYTEALKGTDNILKPIYDSQESVYTNIFSLLNEAVTNLNATTNAFDVSGDVCYGGDMAKWKKAAYAIMARHQLQLSNINGNDAYTKALDAVHKGFASNDDDFMVPFEAANKNPIYQFMDQRGDIRMGATLINMLKDVNDPRLPFYAEKDGDGNYTGSDAASENTSASKPGTYNSAEDSPTYLMTYAELKFIEAECLFNLQGAAAAQTAYEEAVAASVLRVTGSANTLWLAINITGDPVTLEKIINQKYIDGYSTNQPYADYRRTGFPTLTPAAAGVIPNIPTRFPYAQSELDYNTANVPTVQISDKVWWDN